MAPEGPERRRQLRVCALACGLGDKVVSLIFQNGEGIYNFQGLRAFKDKFNPAWSPVYIAVPSNAGKADLALVGADIAQLVSRGNTRASRA